MTVQNDPTSDATPVDPNQAIETLVTPVPPAPANDSIQISKQEYAQLMTQIAMLQNQVEATTKPSEPPPSYAGKNINQLTNEEMFDLISRQQQESQSQVVNALMQIAVKEEIRDLGDTYPDFKKDSAVREAVLKIAENNTSLSLEQAYLIHKGKTPPPVVTPTPTPTPVPTPSSKPGVAAQTVEPTKVMSVREAAMAAMKSLNYE